MTSDSRDKLYTDPIDEVPRFEFNEAVSNVFGDMIRRSVPGYGTAMRTTGVLVSEVVRDGGTVYDLGCSLGEAAHFVLAACGDANLRLVLLDSSEPMIARARERFSDWPNVSCVCADLLHLDYEEAVAFVLNYTLQFISRQARTGLLCRLHERLLPGGALVLSEKIRLDTPEQDAIATRRHHGFKRLMGYSDREIEQKREALEDVLVPDTLKGLKSRLRQAGFGRIDIWFTCLNWVSLIAYKTDRVQGSR